MKTTILTGLLIGVILTAGCGKKESNPKPSAHSNPSPATNNFTLTSFPALQPAYVAYLHGDKSTAVSDFLAVDWNVRPLFAPDSVLGFSEGQFHALAEADYHAKSVEHTTQLAMLKRLGSIVEEAGLMAVKRGDSAQASKCFTSLKQFGTALNDTNYTLIVQLSGKGYIKMGDAGLAKTK